MKREPQPIAETVYRRRKKKARRQGWRSVRAKQRDRDTARKMFRNVRDDQLDEAAAFVRDWEHTPYPCEYVRSKYAKFNQHGDTNP
jgi:hypothetical protein